MDYIKSNTPTRSSNSPFSRAASYWVSKSLAPSLNIARFFFRRVERISPYFGPLVWLRFKRQPTLLRMVREITPPTHGMPYRFQHDTGREASKFFPSCDDVEVLYQAHRFHWLLEDLLAGRLTREGLVSWIRIWITHRERFDSRVFETYSVCERILNWLTAIRVMGISLDQVPEVSESLREQIHHAAKNLEYHGWYTNNHILNNGRALYIAGSRLSLRRLHLLGREILIRETDEFLQEGSLQEGSSHYQLLLTRTLLEVWSEAISVSDREFCAWLEPRVGKALYTCLSLGGSSEVPWFGDISPDVSTRWLNGYPFTSVDDRRPSPWYRIHGISGPRVVKANYSKQKVRYHRLHVSGCTGWVIHKERCGAHGHGDNGHLVLSLGHHTVIADPGLISYEARLSKGHRRAEFHNIPKLDGKTLNTDPGGLFGRDNIHSQLRVIERQTDQIEYVLTAPRPGIPELKRRVTVEEDGFQIIDCIHNVRSGFSYENSWLFSGHLEGDLSGLHLKLPDDRVIQVVVSGPKELRVSVHQAHRAVDYGVQSTATRLSVSAWLNHGESVRLHGRLL